MSLDQAIGQGGLASVAFEPASQATLADRTTQLELEFDPYPYRPAEPTPFSVGRVQFSLPAPLRSLGCTNNVLLAYLSPPPTELDASSPPVLIRIDLAEPSVVDTIELPLPPLFTPGRTTTLHAFHVDPTARHGIVSLSSGDNYYLALSPSSIAHHSAAAATAARRTGAPSSSGPSGILGPAIRTLPKLKGHLISCVGWNPASYSNPSSVASSTKEILLGTSNGHVLGAVLVDPVQSHSDQPGLNFPAFGRSGGAQVDRWVKHLWSTPDHQPITGLSFDLWTPSPSSSKRPGSTKKSTRRVGGVVTTANWIYQFVDRAPVPKGKREEEEVDGTVVERLFGVYASGQMAPRSLELPSSSSPSSLHLFRPTSTTSSSPSLLPPSFLAWSSGSGIFQADLCFTAVEPGDGVIENSTLIPVPPRTESTETQVGSRAVLGSGSLDASRRGVRGGEEGGEGEEGVVGMAVTEWHFVVLYRDRIKVIRRLDDRIVHEETLDLRPDERLHGITSDPFSNTYWVHSDRSIFEVLVKDEARDVWRVFLDRGAFATALSHAKTSRDRDAVLTAQADSLFSQAKYIPSAQLYARTSKSFEEVVLGFIDRGEREALRLYLVSRLERLSKTDRTERMLLATWLTEIYLGRINELEDLAASETSDDDAGNLRAEQGLIEDELRQFFKTYLSSLDPRTTYDLIASHGRTDIMLHFALLSSDHERILRHHVQEDAWTSAIQTLSGQDDLELYYRFAPVLVRHAPVEATTAFRRQPALDVKRLVPALITPRSAKEPARNVEAVIGYIEYAITELDNTDAAVYNALLTLYATQRDVTDEGPLLRFLASTPDNPLTGKPYYDLDYALRLCKANGKLQACGLIYGKLGLYESSVDLALETGDLELAKLNADKPEDDPVLRKKLWLKVARYVVDHQKDLKAAMRFLESTDLLKIEDILPFFPDFVVIDDFKEEICAALEGYSAHIERLKDEMDDAARTADAIKADIADLAGRFVVLDPADTCAHCSYPLLTRQFYVFPCRHGFHADCLINEVTLHMPQHQLRRLLSLQTKLAQAQQNGSMKGAASESTLIADSKKLALASVQGLDQVRKLILPDALVGAIGGGVGAIGTGVGALGGVLPIPGVRNRTEVQDLSSNGDLAPMTAVQAPHESQPRPPGHGLGAAQLGVSMRKTKEGKKMTEVEKVKEELDELLASKCVLCDLALNSLDRPFVEAGEEI